MNRTPAPHPDLEKLARFRRGALEAEELEDIASHVAGCTGCCHSLRTLPDDALVDLVRQSLHGVAREMEMKREAAESPAWKQPGWPADLVDHPRYEVLALLGSGGMGSVYKARHRLMDRPVALKVIKRGLLHRPAVVERFRREVKAAARLSHPNIVTAYDAEQAGDTHFLVMEFVEGVTLAQFIAERGPLPPAEACEYARQAALALQHAHDKGTVHRDMKPQNLMRTPEGRIKVLDFGLARFASEARQLIDSSDNTEQPGADQSFTSTGCILGTAAYIAPEQLADPHAADIRADIYSLGCTLYLLLHGHPLTSEDTKMHPIPTHDSLPARTGDEPGLGRILNRMLAHDPAQRYQTPAEAADALASFTADETPDQTGDRSIPTPAVRRMRKWRWLVLAFLLLCGGLTAAAVYRISTDKGEIVIETDDPKIEVVILQGGKKVAIVDGETKRKVELRSGEYELNLDGDAGDLRLSTKSFTLQRGEKKIVTVRHEPPGGTATTSWNTAPQTGAWGHVQPYNRNLPLIEWAPLFEKPQNAPRLKPK